MIEYTPAALRSASMARGALRLAGCSSYGMRAIAPAIDSSVNRNM